MYLPKHFSIDEWQKTASLIRENSFATVLSYPENDRPNINHLPVIFGDDENSTLIGHMARRNPQWNHFLKNPEATFIFHSPHTYITPNWYRSGRDVPTWNYAVVHLHGKIEIVESFQGQIDILKALTLNFEGTKPGAWQFELPEDLLDEASLTSAIVSFKFFPDLIETKFKLSQNRTEADRQGVIDGLGERSDEMSLAIRKMMRGY